MNRGSDIGHGSRNRSSGYGFPPELDVRDPTDEDIAKIIKNLAKYGGERVGTLYLS